MYKGKVTFVDVRPDKRFGFVRTEEGLEAFFHLNDGPENNERLPLKGDCIMFEPVPSKKGLRASIWVFEGSEEMVVGPSWTGEVPPVNPWVRDNLTVFGQEDFQVVGVVQVTNTYTYAKTAVQVGPMLLSQLCRDIRKTLRMSPIETPDPYIEVIRDGVVIGRVDDEKRFHYEEAPDLLSALSWFVATDLGQKRMFKHGLQGDVKGIVTTMGRAPVNGSQEDLLKFYRGDFTNQVKHKLAFPRKSQFMGGHNAVLELFWKLASKQVHGRVLSFK